MITLFLPPLYPDIQAGERKRGRESFPGIRWATQIFCASDWRFGSAEYFGCMNLASSSTASSTMAGVLTSYPEFQPDQWRWRLNFELSYLRCLSRGTKLWARWGDCFYDFSCLSLLPPWTPLRLCTVPLVIWCCGEARRNHIYICMYLSFENLFSHLRVRHENAVNPLLNLSLVILARADFLGVRFVLWLVRRRDSYDRQIVIQDAVYVSPYNELPTPFCDPNALCNAWYTVESFWFNSRLRHRLRYRLRLRLRLYSDLWRLGFFSSLQAEITFRDIFVEHCITFSISFATFHYDLFSVTYDVLPRYWIPYKSTLQVTEGRQFNFQILEKIYV